MNTKTAAPSTHTVGSVFLLGAGEGSGSVDRTVLRSIGVSHIRKLTSGRDALALLADPSFADFPEALVLEERLADMNGIEFLCQLRLVPHLAGLPVVFLASGVSPLVRAAASSKSCALLHRPYTGDDAARALAAAMRPESLRAPLPLPEMLIPRAGRPEKAPVSVERAVERDLFQVGLAAFRAGDTEHACALLARCHAFDPSHAEACLTLARIHAGEGRREEAGAWLARAGTAMLRRGDFSRASEIFSRLPRGDFGNPMFDESVNALRQSEYRVAAQLFMEMHRRNPATPMHVTVGRACMFTGAPQDALRGICEALGAMGHGSTAKRLAFRLSAREESSTPAPSEGFLDRFPRLYDIVNVASHTFSTWRKAV